MSETNTTQSGGIGILGLLGIVFVVLKLTDWIDWSWWYVTLPFWGGLALGLVLVLFALALKGLGAFLEWKYPPSPEEKAARALRDFGRALENRK